MKTYLDLVSTIQPNSFLHYWGFETTVEEFVDQHKQLGLTEKKKVKSEIEKEFPHPYLGRISKETIPVKVNLDTELEIMTWYHETFKYPKGTTHFKFDFFIKGDFASSYNSERDIPLALKNEGEDWFTYKVIDDVEQWFKLPRGSRTFDDVHDLETIESFEAKELIQPEYVIDAVIKKLEKSTNNILILELYTASLTDFFEKRHNYDHIVKYFKLNRVFPVRVIDDNTHYPEEAEEVNKQSIALNALLYNVVSTEEFKIAYNEVINDK